MGTQIQCGHPDNVPVRIGGRVMCHDCAMAVHRRPAFTRPAPGFGPGMIEEVAPAARQERIDKP